MNLLDRLFLDDPRRVASYAHLEDERIVQLVVMFYLHLLCWGSGTMLPRQPYAQSEIRTEEMLLSHRRELIGQVTKCCYLLKELYLDAVYVACSTQEESRNV